MGVSMKYLNALEKWCAWYPCFPRKGEVQGRAVWRTKLFTSMAYEIQRVWKLPG